MKLAAIIFALVILVYVTIIGPMDYADALAIEAEFKTLRSEGNPR